MAKSKFEYVRQFEADDTCLPNCWIVVRVDGCDFQRFTDLHYYMKPNDERGLRLMTRAAQAVMAEFSDVVLAYGQSDEYSFVFHRHCRLFNRRGGNRLMSSVISLFASSFTLYWPHFFNVQQIKYPPSFQAALVIFPSELNLRDYLSWRQADCHINNLYNTCFWKLVQDKGLNPAQAENRLKGTLTSDKNELLLKDLSTNYNTLPDLYRKGTLVIRPQDKDSGETSVRPSSPRLNHSSSSIKRPQRLPSIVLHVDIISNSLWDDYPYLLQ